MSAYAACVAASACTPIELQSPSACTEDLPALQSHPVNCADWDQASAYCAWVGTRLPTEWEWEWAARGRDEARVHPWGAAAPGTLACWFGTAQGVGTCLVGAYSPAGDSRDDVQDLAGNVWEWTDSVYELSTGYRIIRGGSWNTGNASTTDELHADYRAPLLPGSSRDILGFRCALTP
ncbi:MAG: hypothetical protein DRI90_10870 [Deltaproteobacteria bacterium]|nr:MAG: hypothetical protein DRI90_10870 [Deltaproteobacteria bacterium]